MTEKDFDMLENTMFRMDVQRRKAGKKVDEFLKSMSGTNSVIIGHYKPLSFIGPHKFANETDKAVWTEWCKLMTERDNYDKAYHDLHNIVKYAYIELTGKDYED